jgi:hypothetical protein
VQCTPVRPTVAGIQARDIHMGRLLRMGPKGHGVGLLARCCASEHIQQCLDAGVPPTAHVWTWQRGTQLLASHVHVMSDKARAPPQHGRKITKHLKAITFWYLLQAGLLGDSLLTRLTPPVTHNTDCIRSKLATLFTKIP